MDDRLRSAVAQVLGTAPESIELTLLQAPANSDGATKLRVLDRAGEPCAVVLSSPASAPEIVERGMTRAAEAKAVLAGDAASIPMQPLGQGAVDGRSFAVLPLGVPGTENRVLRKLHRVRIRPAVHQWLRDVAQQSRSREGVPPAQSRFASVLRSATESDLVPVGLRDAASRARAELLAGTWAPYHVLMHADFWEGNILTLRGGPWSWTPRISIIDWPGAVTRGYAIFDLLRFSQSIGTSVRIFRRELAIHLGALEDVAGRTRAHIAAALGHILENLEQFPPRLFSQMAARCDDYLTRARL